MQPSPSAETVRPWLPSVRRSMPSSCLRSTTFIPPRLVSSERSLAPPLGTPGEVIRDGFGPSVSGGIRFEWKEGQSSMRISKVFAIAALVSSGALGSAFCTSSKPPASSPPPAAASSPATGPAAPEGYVRKVTQEDLAGNWYVEMKLGSRSVEGSLHFSIVSGVLAGSFTRGDGSEQELKNIKISGDEVSWDAEGTGGSQHAKGKVDGSSMKGTMKRAAARRSASGSGDTPEGDGDSTPPPSGGGYSGGGRRGGGGGGGRRGGGGGRGGSSEVTFTAYKSGEPPTGTPAAVASPTPAPR